MLRRSSSIILRHKLALGDAVLLTALARDIQRAYPGQYQVLIDGHFSEVWDHNPHARKLRPGDAATMPPAVRVELDYRHGSNGILATNRPGGPQTHMLYAYHSCFTSKIGMTVPVTAPCGDLHLTAEERQPQVPGRYWLIVAGGKLDCTTKIWWAARWQQVVDNMTHRGMSIVQAGARFNEHVQPELHGVIDMVGRTRSARDFFSLVANAEGIICGITAAMHIASVFNKPCVVIAGGREAPWWESYTNAYAGAFGPDCPPVSVEHRFLHTVGLLDCCGDRGCWKHRTVPLNNGDRWDKPKERCKLPVLGARGTSCPSCLDRITVDHVLEAVFSYYEAGMLPPIGQPKRTYSVAELNDRDSYVTAPADRVAVAASADVKGFKIPKTVLKSDYTPAIVPPDASAEFYKAELGVPFRAAARPSRPELIDHSILGGKLTVCVLCYGPHTELARRCIGSILQTLPVDCLDLRIGLNAACDDTQRFVRGLTCVTKIYDHPENPGKYPVMREMWHDSEQPITTPYVVWFDDDTQIIDRQMWSQLCKTIVANHPQGCRLYGWHMIHDLRQFTRNGHDPRRWFRAAPWWQGRHLRVPGTHTEQPNGTVLSFVPGWFFAVASDVIRQAQVPDVRLAHNGDICIGEQVHQAGYKLKNFNANKTLVYTPPREEGGRRGNINKPFPWSHP